MNQWIIKRCLYAMSNCATPYRAISFISFIHYSRGGEVVGYSILLQAGVWVSNSSRDRPKLLNLVETTPQPNARQLGRVSRVFRDDHYKRMSRFTVNVARLNAITAQWPEVPSIGQNLQPFTGNGEVILVKNSRMEHNKYPLNKPIHLYMK